MKHNIRIIGFFSILFFSNYSFCLPASNYLNEIIDKSTLIFIGKVLKIEKSHRFFDDDFGHVSIYYAVTEIKCLIKGEDEQRVIIKYIPTEYIGDLGNDFIIGEERVFFLSNKTSDNSYFIGPTGTIKVQNDIVGPILYIIGLDDYLPLKEFLKKIKGDSHSELFNQC